MHFRCFSAFFQGFCGVSQFWGQSKAKPSQFRTGWPSGPVLGPSLSCASLSAGSALAFAVNKAALLKEGSALKGAPKHLQSQRPCTGRDSHDEQFSAKKLNLVNPTVIMAVVRVAEAAEESVVREAEALVEGAGRREALAPGGVPVHHPRPRSGRSLQAWLFCSGSSVGSSISSAARRSPTSPVVRGSR